MHARADLTEVEELITADRSFLLGGEQILGDPVNGRSAFYCIFIYGPSGV